MADLQASSIPWWKGAVVYQIYPRSFRDANGDGIGDLRGCLEGLEHVASLGVDAIWLSPFFTSPMRDFGYDVSDFRGVDPLFGTLADFDLFLREAHEAGLRVIIDQVYSHTSDRHPWFVESRNGRRNDRADWYVWADPREDGTPPNNWQSVFGGAAWAWDARRCQYYLHNFLASQPDLNLHHPLVQEALLDVARFWLDRGVDGFRLDALNFAMHDPELRDNPAQRDPERRARATRPFDYQEHRYSRSHPHLVTFIERIRAVMESYGSDRFSVAEVGGDDPLDEMQAYTRGANRLNSAYGFDFLYAPALTPALVRRTVRAWPGQAGEGWPSWAFSNHDAPRAVSRWCPAHADTAHYARLALLLLVSLRGNVFLYQGEELGLPAADVPFACLQDPEAIVNWPATLGRDSARTPMPWRHDLPNAGFTTGMPWLPVDPRHQALAVDLQEARGANSTLAFTRQLLRMRRTTPALRAGSVRLAADDGHDGGEPLVFVREAFGERVLCAFNLDPTRSVTLPASSAAEGAWELLADVGSGGAGDGAVPVRRHLPQRMPPLSGLVAREQR